MSFLSDVVDSFFRGVSDVEKNMGTKAIVAVAFVCSSCALVLYSLPIPEWFVNITIMIVSTYFGASIQKSKE